MQKHTHDLRYTTRDACLLLNQSALHKPSPRSTYHHSRTATSSRNYTADKLSSSVRRTTAADHRKQRRAGNKCGRLRVLTTDPVSGLVIHKNSANVSPLFYLRRNDGCTLQRKYYSGSRADVEQGTAVLTEVHLNKNNSTYIEESQRTTKQNNLLRRP